MKLFGRKKPITLLTTVVVRWLSFEKLQSITKWLAVTTVVIAVNATVRTRTTHVAQTVTTAWTRILTATEVSLTTLHAPVGAA